MRGVVPSAAVAGSSGHTTSLDPVELARRAGELAGRGGEGGV